MIALYLLQARRTLVCRAFGHLKVRVIDNIHRPHTGLLLIVDDHYHCRRCKRGLIGPGTPAAHPGWFLLVLAVLHAAALTLASAYAAPPSVPWRWAIGSSTVLTTATALLTPTWRGTHAVTTDDYPGRP